MPFYPNKQKKYTFLTSFFFFLGYEVFERMAYYGIATNLVLYLSKELYQGTVTSSNNVTNWVGTVWMTPILGAYIADAHLGRYWTFVISSCIYLMVIQISIIITSLLYMYVYMYICIYGYVYMFVCMNKLSTFI